MAQSAYRFLGNKNRAIAEQVRRINKSIGTVIERCEGDVASTLFTQAALIAAEARQYAPVQSGKLRESVRVEPRQNGAKFAVRILVGGPSTKKAVENGKAGAAYPYDYARAIEFGTENMPAKPFFFPIYRARKKGMRAAVKKAVAISVRKNFR